MFYNHGRNSGPAFLQLTQLLSLDRCLCGLPRLNPLWIAYLLLSMPKSHTSLNDMPVVWEIHTMLPMVTTPKMFSNCTPSGLVAFINPSTQNRRNFFSLQKKVKKWYLTAFTWHCLSRCVAVYLVHYFLFWYTTLFGTLLTLRFPTGTLLCLIRRFAWYTTYK